ncbi:hypothetical protein [Streptomyces aculeolatus]|uniref:hypothetical protein n=1 Tax=Streptomyces aculeolatus TaxID=270689 RepID=UPI001CEDCFB9|nr:hypothetical protein [Streptomyces aculeolatus]
MEGICNRLLDELVTEPSTDYLSPRLRLQRQASDTLGNALAAGDDSEEPPPAAVGVR